MKYALNVLTLATLAALSSNAHAEIFIDSIGGSEISFEGLVQADMDWYDSDVKSLNNAVNDGTDADYNMRRAELVMKGKGPGMLSWVAGYDAYANKFLDVNVAYRFGDSSVMFGQYKQPNSLEELSSTKNNDFMSKAMTTNLFAMSRRVGAAYTYTNSDVNFGLTASIFGNELTRNQSPSLGTGNGWGTRGYWAPIKNDNQFLHLGLSYVDLEARNSSNQNVARLRVRPDADLSGTRLIDTGNLLDSDRLKVFGVESAYVQGPFKAQAEYMTTTVTRNAGYQDFTGDSWYLYGVWNITGESWSYKNGVVSTPLPNDPGLGMWQVGVRYDTANLNDGSVDYTNPLAPVVTGVLGGEENNWTLGVNWYWRSNFKVALDYVIVNSSKYSTTTKTVVDDNPNITTLRFQFYW
jgi:phosphate-selective porin OprO/OprP